jgi:arylsulfatase A-like enzyme
VPNGKPNILVIWGDDIGISNLSCYSDGMMGYRTPNIDRIANEGMRFTDSYGEQSCTAGRAAFISGQSVYRTGMSKVGVPGVDIGWAAEDPTIAELLKPLGYATGQFGKNHFGDLNKYLPTVHGFDEFFGNLYHLNAEEEPEQYDYPHKDQFPRLYELALPRGVMKCKATDEVSGEPDDPKFGPVGKQTIEDTGPLTAKRMETIDDDIADTTVEYIKRQHDAGNPFFVWCNFTHMHLYTHLKPGSKGQAGMWQSEYHDAMIDHDKNVGTVLDALDDLGIADDTIVIYSTDNGPHRNSWPDAGTTPFRSEKNTNWEGAYRIPELIRWPGKIKAGSVSNDIIQHHDWLPTLLAAAGDPDVSDKLKQGMKAGADGETEYKVHIDGFNLMPYLMGEAEHSPRRGFFYFNDDAEMVGMRFENWKIVFAEQRCQGTLRTWAEPFTPLRVPKLFNLRTDPFEYADITSNTYYEWFLRRDFFVFYATAMASAFLDTFKEFPPRHPPASFSIDQIVKKLDEFLAAD